MRTELDKESGFARRARAGTERLDQEQKLEQRRLRRANELFLQRLELERRRAERNKRKCQGPPADYTTQLKQAAVDVFSYDGNDDFAKSIDEAYRVIRERVAAGGKGWSPP